MADYYFDIETTGLNFRQHKIITIQYQCFDTRTGIPKDDLVILKEWESSEKEILKRFYEFSKFGKEPWKFVMVGTNLNFDLGFIRFKLRKLLDIDLDEHSVYQNHPFLDLVGVLKLLNRGKFKGAKLCLFMGKPDNSSLVPEWYRLKEYDKIIGYIREEAEDFLIFYRILTEQLRNISELRRLLTEMPD
jgi:hypothetical protein